LSEHAEENHEDLIGKSDLKLENLVEASGSGHIRANKAHITAAGRKTEEFQI
jgi:hypothetical protein